MFFEIFDVFVVFCCTFGVFGVFLPFFGVFHWRPGNYFLIFNHPRVWPYGGQLPK